MPLPQQIDHVPDEREAYAPYNFVPLPEQVVAAETVSPAEQGANPRLPRQDSYHPERFHGRIVCTLTSASPLYVRSGYSPEAFAAYGHKAFHELSCAEKEERARFFHYGGETPVIPGSSLRGMLRALVEIVGYGKMDRVTDRKLFYRSVRDANYQMEFVTRLPAVTVAPNPTAPCYQTKIRTGFLRRTATGSYVIEECPMARIDHHAPNPRGLARIPSIPGQQVMLGSGPNSRPNPKYQHEPIYVVCDPTDKDYFFPAQPPRHPNLYLRFRGVQQANFAATGIPGEQLGTLVITGPMQHKHMEFVFLDGVLATHALTHEQIQRFEDDDQVTPWQEQTFPRDKPTPNSRHRDGGLRDGEPLFFLLDSTGQVRFFGRAQLFRLPYGTAPFDFLPAEHHSADLIDLAEAMFGFVRSNRVADGQLQAAAGRIFVGDAHCEPGQEHIWLSEEPITPKILSSPKPTTFQHYLVQTRAEKSALKHYGTSPKETNLRGHKLYWHKDNVAQATLEYAGPPNEQTKQQTRLRPVRADVRFSFTIDIENLSAVELGALLWVLRLCDDEWQRTHQRGPYRLKLGMGKPLGMGVLKLEYELQLSDRTARYKKLFDDAQGWAEPPPAAADQATTAMSAFESYVLHASGEVAANLHNTMRIKCLLALLSWPGPNSAVTRSMEIERDQQQGHRPGRNNNGKVNEYSDRLVLPGPLRVHTPPLPPPPPPPPAPPKQAIKVGVEITGRRQGELRHRTLGKGVKVELNKRRLHEFAIPPGITSVIGFIRLVPGGNQMNGGCRGIVRELVEDGTTLYLVLEQAPKAEPS